MARGKEEVFETAQFNDAKYAQDVKENAERKLQRIKIGLIIALVATISSVLLFLELTPFTDILMGLSFFGSIVSYVVGGGIGMAFKSAWKVAKIGWLLTPFPIDIFTGLVAMMFSIMGFFFIPLLFVAMNYDQCKKDYKEATEYLKYCE